MTYFYDDVEVTFKWINTPKIRRDPDRVSVRVEPDEGLHGHSYIIYWIIEQLKEASCKLNITEWGISDELAPVSDWPHFSTGGWRGMTHSCICLRRTKLPNVKCRVAFSEAS